MLNSAIPPQRFVASLYGICADEYDLAIWLFQFAYNDSGAVRQVDYGAGVASYEGIRKCALSPGKRSSRLYTHLNPRRMIRYMT